ncbi:phosphatidylserine decarboxylase family protein [Fluviicola sp.]|uniref:phosphatidylserine decarboxylase family protein n=1 Tax=Fluviicola sp. TaxID=1917219 RepID=UPI0026250BC0|nr:phosphatidylserine decarboxylase family protein [Fluviicola sp.]
MAKKEKLTPQKDWYTSKYGVIAGYLPQDKKDMLNWHKQLVSDVETEKQKTGTINLQPSVQALSDLIHENGIVRMYVTQMINEVPATQKKIRNTEQLLETLNYIIQRAPEYNSDPAKRNTFPLSALFVYMMFTPSGEAAFRLTEFNTAIRNILQAWCNYLDSPASCNVLNTGKTGWLSPSAYELNQLNEFIIPDKNAPHWGFKSYNDYFHRQINPQYRPIADPNNPKIIVSANDGTVYNLSRKVKLSDTFWIKSQPYSLINMLDNSPHVTDFIGGDVLQSFLSGANFHRWNAPVSGKVIEARIIDGLMFSELHVEGFDDGAGILSQGYESAVNTRGLVIIESEDKTIGKVCVMPIGITEISSVTIEVKVGQHVKKGEELGYFSYGGSTLCLVFQPKAIKEFNVYGPTKSNQQGEPINVNSQIAVAN